MYILHALPDSGVGRAGSSLLRLLGCLDRSEFSVKVLLPEGSRLIPLFSARGISVLTLPLRPDRSFSLRDLVRLIRLLRREKPELLHTHGFAGARIAGRLAGVRIAVSTRCRAFPRIHSPILRRLFRLFYRRITTFTVAASCENRRRLILGGVSRRQTAVIPDMPPALLRLDRTERAAFRSALGIPADAFVFGAFSRLEPERCPRLLLAALSELSVRAKNVWLLLPGDGREHAALLREAERLGIAGQVLLPGFVPDIAPWLGITDVLVSPSSSFSLSVREGAMLGIPAILCDTPENRSANGRNGSLFFRAGDKECLISMLDRLRLHPWERALLSACAEGSAPAWDATETVRSYETLYRALARPI